MKGPKNAKMEIFVKYFFFLNPICLNRFMFDFAMTQFPTFSGASEALFWVTVFPDSFTFAVCYGNHKDDPDGDDDDDDDYDDDDNDDDGDDDDDKYLSKNLQNPWK